MWDWKDNPNTWMWVWKDNPDTWIYVDRIDGQPNTLIWDWKENPFIRVYIGLEREPDTWINVDGIGHTTKHMDGGLERQPIHTGVQRIGERTKLKLTTRIRQTTNPSKAITPTYM